MQMASRQYVPYPARSQLFRAPAKPPIGQQDCGLDHDHGPEGLVIPSLALPAKQALNHALGRVPVRISQRDLGRPALPVE